MREDAATLDKIMANTPNDLALLKGTFKETQKATKD